MNLKKAAYYYQCSANAGDSEGIYRYGKLIEQRVINTKEAAEGNEYGAAIREAIKHYQ